MLLANFTWLEGELAVASTETNHGAKFYPRPGDKVYLVDNSYGLTEIGKVTGSSPEVKVIRGTSHVYRGSLTIRLNQTAAQKTEAVTVVQPVPTEVVVTGSGTSETRTDVIFETPPAPVESTTVLANNNGVILAPRVRTPIDSLGIYNRIYEAYKTSEEYDIKKMPYMTGFMISRGGRRALIGYDAVARCFYVIGYNTSYTGNDHYKVGNGRNNFDTVYRNTRYVADYIINGHSTDDLQLIALIPRTFI